tara:strand:+ start:942 stop:1169 length:228 start_codon:yes stop_codon:yes gene_type:complete
MYTIEVTTYYYNNTTTQRMLYRFDSFESAHLYLTKELELEPLPSHFPDEYIRSGEYRFSHNEYARPTYKIVKETT